MIINRGVKGNAEIYSTGFTKTKMYVMYYFYVDGKRYIGNVNRSSIPEKEIGDTISIRYLKEDPSQSAFSIELNTRTIKFLAKYYN